MDEFITEVLEETPKLIDVDGYTFEIIPQDGCISQCLILGDGEELPPQNEIDRLASIAIEKRENGEFAEINVANDIV